jgi:hypothetical protein
LKLKHKQPRILSIFASSKEPVFINPSLLSLRKSTEERTESKQPLNISPSAERIFPKTVAMGIKPYQLLKKWSNPISRLEELYKSQTFALKKVELKPFSLWKPLATGISKLSLAYPNRGYKATLFRSPDRVVGLADAIRKSDRTKTCGLSEALTFAYVKDSRFVLLTCLLLGFCIGWLLVAEQLLVQPVACCSPEFASALKEAVECPMRSIGFPCVHSGIHDQVINRHVYRT